MKFSRISGLYFRLVALLWEGARAVFKKLEKVSKFGKKPHEPENIHGFETGFFCFSLSYKSSSLLVLHFSISFHTHCQHSHISPASAFTAVLLCWEGINILFWSYTFKDEII